MFITDLSTLTLCDVELCVDLIQECCVSLRRCSLIQTTELLQQI